MENCEVDEWNDEGINEWIKNICISDVSNPKPNLPCFDHKQAHITCYQTNCDIRICYYL